MSLIDNPFLNKSSDIIFFDENEGINVVIDQNNASKYFTHVFILVKRNNEPIPSNFYNWQISLDIFEQVSSNLLIYKTSISILKNKKHFDSCIILSNEQLKLYNIFNYELANKNIVITIFNIEYLNLLHYLEQYESNNTLKSIYNINILNKYFGIDTSNFKANEFITQNINNLEESQYWTNYHNCLINMSNKFKNRTISFKALRITDKNIISIIKKIFDTSVINNTKKDDYIKEISQESKEDYIDMKNYHFYKINQTSEFTHKDINHLFSIFNEKQKFFLLSNLMVSKKYCHLVLNNEFVLQTMKKEIEQFAPLFKYLMSYAWIIFYMEESLKKSWVKTSDNFIFDINTASKLLVFPFNYAKPKENPYSPLLISDSELNPLQNVCGIGNYSSFYESQGICNLEEFKIRMNIFCTRNPNYDIFDGFDFDKYKVAITGSLMSACLQKYHPLMSRFLNSNIQTENFNNFFDEYYANSDIDIMFKIKDNFEFIDNVHEFYNQIILNICKINAPHATQTHIKLILNKIGYLFVTEEFINKNIDFDESEQITDKVKYIIENINEDSVKSKFKPFYEQMCEQKYKELVKNYSDKEINELINKYPDIFIQNEIDFRIYINYNNTKKYKYFNENINSDIDLVFTYKYKIESPYINHPLELFSLKYDDFFSIVAQFHLPCVRAYYNGSNVYLTPKCISAHMTFMNSDYQYISGLKDPFDIINKYRMRGFGTWLNINEKKQFVKYSREVPFWNNLYSIDSEFTDTEAASNILGIMDLNHKLFKPRLYNMNSFVNAMFVDTTNRYNSIAINPVIYEKSKSMYSYTQLKFKSVNIKEINWDNFITINKDGYIIPLKKWIIAYTWDIYVNEYKTISSAKPNIYHTSQSLKKV